MKRTLFVFVLILFNILLIEAFSFTGLEFIRRKKHFVYLPTTQNVFSPLQKERIQKLLDHASKYIAHHPVLGWAIKPNGADIYHRANSQGFRADKDAELNPPAGKIRICAYGDSFIHSDDVQNDEAWLKRLSDIDPRLDTLNFGVPGYGTDQAFLRYQETGTMYHPDIVLIGFMSENPRRNVNVFRPFYNRKTQMPLSKPRFILKEGTLTLLENPLTNISDYQNLLDHQNEVLLRLSRNDYYYHSTYKKSLLDVSATVRLFKVLKILYLDRPDRMVVKGVYNTDAEAFKVTMAILEEFYKTVKRDGSRPVLLLIPNRQDLNGIKKHPEKPRIYAPYLQAFADKGWLFIDLADMIVNDEKNSNIAGFFGSGEHYSATGNQRVAEYIYEFLVEKDLLKKSP